MKRVLQQLWAGWKRVAHRLGRIQTAILMTIVYFLVISPWGALMRLSGWDPLETAQRYRRRDSNWRPIADGEPDHESLKRLS